MSEASEPLSAAAIYFDLVRVVASYSGSADDFPFPREQVISTCEAVGVDPATFAKDVQDRLSAETSSELEALFARSNAIDYRPQDDILPSLSASVTHRGPTDGKINLRAVPK